MNKRHTPLIIAGLLLSAQAAWATGILTFDAATFGEAFITATNSLRQVAQQAQQLEHEVTQIQHLYTQVQQGYTNLKNFNVNYAADLVAMATGLDTKLAQARQLSYQAGSVLTQLQQIYGAANAVLTGDQQNALRQRWVNVNQEATQVAAQVQAIQQQLRDSAARVAELTRRTSTTQGNLDTLQLLGQQQGQTNQQLLSMEEQLAVQARLQTLRAAEDAAREQAALVWERQWTPAGAQQPYTGQGRALRLVP
jgi:P-type conjugative transfer protein TrbJ